MHEIRKMSWRWQCGSRCNDFAPSERDYSPKIGIQSEREREPLLPYSKRVNVSRVRLHLMFWYIQFSLSHARNISAQSRRALLLPADTFHQNLIASSLLDVRPHSIECNSFNYISHVDQINNDDYLHCQWDRGNNTLITSTGYTEYASLYNGTVKWSNWIPDAL